MRSTLTTLVVGLLLLGVTSGCGGDGTGSVDAARTDAALHDASAVDGGAADAATTACGTLSCDPTISVCVSCQCGGPTRYTCEPIPSGCEADRTCACLAATLCAPTGGNPVALCSDGTDNTIDCDRGLD